MTTRLSVNINDFTAEVLPELAAKKGTSVTEIVRRSVSLLEFLENAERDGSTIILEEKENFWGDTRRSIVSLG